MHPITRLLVSFILFLPTATVATTHTRTQSKQVPLYADTKIEPPSTPAVVLVSKNTTTAQQYQSRNTVKTLYNAPQQVGSISEGDLSLLLQKYDWNWHIALKIVYAESGGNPNSINNNPRTGDYSVGLFQINLFGDNAKHRPSEEWLKVPENNINYAYHLYVWDHGWCDWSTARAMGYCR